MKSSTARTGILPLLLAVFACGGEGGPGTSTGGNPIEPPTPPSGSIVVRTVTNGPLSFYIFFVAIDGHEVGAVGAGGGSSRFPVSAGQHGVALYTGGCRVENNYRTVVVEPGATTVTTFRVTCP